MIRGFVLLGVAVLFNGAANVLMKKGMVGADAGAGTAAMIPEPVPMSAMVTSCGLRVTSSITISTICSVSGRGMRTF